MMVALVVFFALVSIGVVSFFALHIDSQRHRLAIENNRLHELLNRLLDENENTSKLEEDARTTLNKLIDIKEVKIKKLKKALVELEDENSTMREELETTDEEMEEDDEFDDKTATFTKPKDKAADKIASISIALQRRMRKAREIVDSAVCEKKPVNTEALAEILNYDLSTLEQDIRESDV